MSILLVIGTLAAISTPLGLLPQVLKTVRTRSTADISLSTFLLLGSASALWVVYGLWMKDYIIILPNLVIFPCAVIISLFKVRYG